MFAGKCSACWIRYLLFNNGLNITAHTVAMWLTVSLAVFRYVAVCHPTVGSRVCTLRRARIAVVAVVASTLVFCCPNYTMFRVVPLADGGFWFDTNTFITEEVINLNFWIFGVVLKVRSIPEVAAIIIIIIINIFNVVEIVLIIARTKGV